MPPCLALLSGCRSSELGVGPGGKASSATTSKRKRIGSLKRVWQGACDRHEQMLRSHGFRGSEVSIVSLRLILTSVLAHLMRFCASCPMGVASKRAKPGSVTRTRKQSVSDFRIFLLNHQLFRTADPLMFDRLVLVSSQRDQRHEVEV